MSQLLVWPIVIPLMAALLLFITGRFVLPIIFLASVASLGAAFGLTMTVRAYGVQRHRIGGWGAPLGIDLCSDGLSALLVCLVAIIITIVAGYAYHYFSVSQQRSPRQSQAFWPLFFLLATALNALLLTADIFNYYVTLELLTLSAVPLITLSGTRLACSSAMRYLLIAIVASLSYMLGVGLLYAHCGTLDIGLLARRIEPGTATWLAAALITIGLLTKSALFPMHFWLPSAHANAPAPVSALLSGLVVKGSFYILLRLWFQVFIHILNPASGHLLAMLGALAILWGAIQALRQVKIKMVIACSTVSQIGYLFLSLAVAVKHPLAWNACVFFILAHAFAKSSLFLTAGNILHHHPRGHIEDLAGLGERSPLMLFCLGLAGITIMGMPPTAGFIGKWQLLQACLISGQWWWAVVTIVGSLLAAAYIFRLVARGFQAGEKSEALAQDWVSEIPPLLLGLLALSMGLLSSFVVSLLQIGSPFSTG